jgi:hypothetical protein
MQSRDVYIEKYLFPRGGGYLLMSFGEKYEKREEKKEENVKKKGEKDKR